MAKLDEDDFPPQSATADERASLVGGSVGIQRRAGWELWEEGRGCVKGC